MLNTLMRSHAVVVTGADMQLKDRGFESYLSLFKNLFGFVAKILR